MSTISLEIHPAIGIARVGRSQEFFLGPEPGLPIETVRRDASGALKRQAARFRVFECTRDDNGVLTDFTELTPDKATITWTVHLVNRKAAAPRFLVANQPNTDPTKRRNNAVGDPTASPDKDLIIEPGSQSLTGPNQGSALFDGGTFKGTGVPLGEMSTDDQGRLIVVGGFGQSASIPATPLTNFADNDNWHDDSSDGPVSATVHFLDGRTNPDCPVDKPAWVIACQPDFAPGIGNMVTLYDAFEDVAITRGVRSLPTFTPAFDRDVWPILQRALDYQWVNKFNRTRHRPGAPGDFHSFLPAIGDPATGHAERQFLFSLLRDPDHPATRPQNPAMPALFGDDYFSDNTLVQTLTRTQYRILREWANDTFTATGPPAELDPFPEGLTRAALEACVGASFCPGIEAGRKIRDANIYMAGEIFRFDHAKLKPGELTESMALPWQADFALCQWEEPNSGPAIRGRGWWPAQRPDHVLVAPNTTVPGMKDWDRGASSMAAMVENWDKLGIVFETTDASGNRVFVETQRDPNSVLGIP